MKLESLLGINKKSAIKKTKKVADNLIESLEQDEKYREMANNIYNDIVQNGFDDVKEVLSTSEYIQIPITNIVNKYIDTNNIPVMLECSFNQNYEGGYIDKSFSNKHILIFPLLFDHSENDFKDLSVDEKVIKIEEIVIPRIEDIKIIFIHELIHLFDGIRHKNTYKHSSLNMKGIETQEELDKQYFNSPEEINAYFQQMIIDFEEKWQDENPNINRQVKDRFVKSFDGFFKELINSSPLKDAKLSEKTLHKLQRRAYTYWKENIKSRKLFKSDLNESFIQTQNNEMIYYTSSSMDFLSIVKNKFNGIPVRVYYDIKKRLYVFGDSNKFVHTQLLDAMIQYSKVYSTKTFDTLHYKEDEKQWEDGYLSHNYLEPYCAMFQVLPDDNFSSYTKGDGYTKGRFTEKDGLIFACREEEYNKCRDEVPLLKYANWSDTLVYMSSKKKINEAYYDEMIEDLFEYKKVSDMTPEEYRAYRDKENEYQRQYQKQYYANMTPEEKRAYNDRRNEYKRQRYANMTPEEKKEFIDKQTEWKRQWVSDMTPEEYRAYRDRKNEYQRQRIANMSPEEYKVFRDKENEYQKQYHTNMTPEGQKVYLVKRHEKIANMSPEERQAYYDKQHKQSKQRYDNMTPEKKRAYLDKQYEHIKQKIADMTPEEKRAYLDKKAEQKKQKIANMTPEEKRAYLDKKAEHNRQKIANMTPEEREAYKEKELVRYKKFISNMTPEKKRAYLDKRAKQQRQRIANMTPEEKRAYLDRAKEDARKRKLLKYYNAAALKDAISVEEFGYLLNKVKEIKDTKLRKIILMKYGFGNDTMTNQEIAKVFGFTSEYNVEDIIRDFLDKNSDVYVDEKGRLRSIEYAEKKKEREEQVNESFEDIGNKTIFTKEIFDIKKLLLSITSTLAVYRLFTDSSKGYWLVLDDLTHNDAIKLAFRNGLYPEFDNEREVQQYFDEKTLSEDTLYRFIARGYENNDIQYVINDVADDYRYAYVIPNDKDSGCILFSRNESDIDEAGLGFIKSKITDTYKFNESLNESANQLSNVNSLGQPIANDETSLNNFWNWFNDSKVIDDNGNPMVMYHGSPKKFDEFKLEYVGKNLAFGKGFYFSNDESLGKSYSSDEGKNYICYINMKNPYIIKSPTMTYDEGLKRRRIFRNNPNVREELLSKGFDGVMTLEDDGYMEVVVFNSNQIKSVDNNGNWSSSNNINESVELSDDEKDVANDYRKRLGIKGGIDLFNDTIRMWEDEINKETKPQVIDMYKRNIERLKAQIDYLKNYKHEDKVFTADKDMNTKAKRYFGLTNKISEAGYIMQDGSLLDFSGKKFGGPSDMRTMDHRTISQAFMNNDTYDVDMETFINNGNIRYLASANAFTIARKPTAKQFGVMKFISDNVNGEIDVECVEDANDWGSDKGFNQEYPKGTDFKIIQRDILSFYTTGQVSSVNRFLGEGKEDMYKEKFIQRVRKHIARVNKYGSRIGKSYPYHDFDKLNSKLLDYYYLDMKSNFEDLSDKEKAILRKAGMKHRTENPHHPEYWDKGNIESLTSIRSNPTRPFNCQNMPVKALEEMCADWCAMSEEFGNTPFEWWEHIKNKRYLFTKEQEEFILDTLSQMWGNNPNGGNKLVNESVDDKYVFPKPDWGNLNELIDPDDRYRYWVDGVRAKIKPYYDNVDVDKLYQDYDGDDDEPYDYSQFENGINEPIDVLKYNGQYIIMDGNHRAAYAKGKYDKIKANVYDVDELIKGNHHTKYDNKVFKNPTLGISKALLNNYERIFGFINEDGSIIQLTPNKTLIKPNFIIKDKNYELITSGLSKHQIYMLNDMFKINDNNYMPVCIDCGKEIFGKEANESDYYMVNDNIWKQACHNENEEYCLLCKSCIEKRLGRELTPKDYMQYKDAPVNDFVFGNKDTIKENYNYKGQELIGYKGINSKLNKDMFPSWFSESPAIARSFGRYVYKAKVKFKNPLDLTDNKSAKYIQPIIDEEMDVFEGIVQNNFNMCKKIWNITFPEDDISNITKEDILRLFKEYGDKLKDKTWFISLREKMNILESLKEGDITNLFSPIIYDNWPRIIKLAKEQGFDGIISMEESDDKKTTDYGFVVFDPKSIIDIEKVKDIKNIEENVIIQERLFPEIDDSVYHQILELTSNGQANAFTKWVCQQYLNGYFKKDLEQENIVPINELLHGYNENKAKLKPIMDYKTPEELENAIISVENSGYKSKSDIEKEAKKGAEKIYEDKDYLILKINTWPACKKYGANTKWCIATNFNPETFDAYNKNDNVYFIIDKVDTERKYACVGNTCWDEFDDKIFILSDDEKDLDKLDDKAELMFRIDEHPELINALQKAYSDYDPEYVKNIIEKYYIV